MNFAESVIRYNASSGRFEVCTSTINGWIDIEDVQRCPVCDVNVDMGRHLEDMKGDDDHAILSVMGS